MRETPLEPGAFAQRLGPLGFITGIFLLNFLGRVSLGPLMPNIESGLGLNHAQAGALFLFISVGYFVAVFSSGWFSQRLTHRRVILISALSVGVMLCLAPLAQGLYSLGAVCLGLGLAAGLYLPSGVAALTSFVRPRDWGKAVAMHEIAPNGGMVLAPLVAELLLEGLTWRGVLALLGALSLILGLAYARRGRGGEQRGTSPSPAAVAELLRLPAVWLMVVFFSLAIGASLGVYTMLPLYLVTERGFDQSWANLMISASRLPGLFMAFGAGWAHDRFGARSSLVTIFAITALATLGLGLLSDGPLIFAIFVQPAVAVCFFPVGFAALSIVAPPHLRGVAVSLATPLAFVLGGGALPAFLGWMGEHHSFGAGIAVFAGLVGLGAVLALLLRPAAKEN
ncbi:MFS transporter [Desulfoferula mesophila]|uniref:MFS transporter n=1 Tax=Desulfoferula mesophila TaxID=3058419 RepID=A0AAU9EUC4_9BACT|nr:MFS transporter [Desulfoferula mesophilus]